MIKDRPDDLPVFEVIYFFGTAWSASENGDVYHELTKALVGVPILQSFYCLQGLAAGGGHIHVEPPAVCAAWTW